MDILLKAIPIAIPVIIVILIFFLILGSRQLRSAHSHRPLALHLA